MCFLLNQNQNKKYIFATRKSETNFRMDLRDLHRSQQQQQQQRRLYTEIKTMNHVKMTIKFYFEDGSRGMTIRYGYNFKTDPERSSQDINELLKGVQINNQNPNRKSILKLKVYNKGLEPMKI